MDEEKADILFWRVVNTTLMVFGLFILLLLVTIGGIDLFKFYRCRINQECHIEQLKRDYHCSPDSGYGTSED